MAHKDSRLNGVGAVVAAGFAAAALFQGKLQIVDRSGVLDKATENDRYIVSRVDVAKRGVILTADGRPLAQDQDTRVLNIDFLKVPRTPAFFMDVAAATGVPASEFQQLADCGLRSRTWRQPLSAAQASELEKVKYEWRADGISLAPSGRRSYPLGPDAAGFVGVLRDGKPQGGLESGFNTVLSGKNGLKVGLVDRSGHFLPMRLDSKTVDRVDGQDLTLTIDSQLQSEATDAVRQAVEDNEATQGVGIILNPHNGDILAMANWPSYDPNTLGEADAGEDKYGYNPCYMAALEPGSMMKILTLSEALDCGAVKDTDGVYCHGQLQVGRRCVRCDMEHGTRAKGLESPAMAIAKSCNVSAATWALRVGYDRYLDYLKRLQILKKPKLGIPSAIKALFNYNDPDQEMHLANLGFGQAINVTPIRLIAALSMVANNGVEMQPRLVKKIGGRTIAPEEIGQIVKPETAGKVMKILQLVIQSDVGTGKSLRIPGYILAGKTGTAQKVNPVTHTMTGGGYVANFVGFVPGVKPEYVILVMIDKPMGGRYYGAQVAGPVFRQLALDVINRYNIPPNAPYNLPPITAAELQTPIAELIYPPYYNAKEAKLELKAKWAQQENANSLLLPKQEPIPGINDPNQQPDRKIQLSEEKKPAQNENSSPDSYVSGLLNLGDQPAAPDDSAMEATARTRRKRRRRMKTADLK